MCLCMYGKKRVINMEHRLSQYKKVGDGHCWREKLAEISLKRIKEKREMKKDQKRESSRDDRKQELGKCLAETFLSDEVSGLFVSLACLCEL